jgi:hypothetical protein
MSTPRRTVTTFPDIDSYPWLVQSAGQLAAVRLVLRGVVTLAEQAPDLSDEQWRSGLAALGRLVR